MRKLTHDELQERQRLRMEEARLPACLAVNNVRSLYNVGALFRTAEGAGFEKIWLCGITGIPPSSQISKTALGAEERLPWEYRESAAAVLAQLRAQGYQIVLLEQTAQSVPYQKFEPRPPLCLVVGNEITGVGETLLQGSDAAIEIEMAGLKNSLNVAVAFAVAAYHIRQKILQR